MNSAEQMLKSDPGVNMPYHGKQGGGSSLLFTWDRSKAHSTQSTTYWKKIDV